jgi:hypothetical protein
LGEVRPLAHERRGKINGAASSSEEWRKNARREGEAGLVMLSVNLRQDRNGDAAVGCEPVFAARLEMQRES